MDLPLGSRIPPIRPQISMATNPKSLKIPLISKTIKEIPGRDPSLVNNPSLSIGASGNP